MVLEFFELIYLNKSFSVKEILCFNAVILKSKTFFIKN